MECFGTTDFDNNSRLITLSAIIISGLHCICISHVTCLKHIIWQSLIFWIKLYIQCSIIALCSGFFLCLFPSYLLRVQIPGTVLKAVAVLELIHTHLYTFSLILPVVQIGNTFIVTGCDSYLRFSARLFRLSTADLLNAKECVIVYAH